MQQLEKHKKYKISTIWKYSVGFLQMHNEASCNFEVTYCLPQGSALFPEHLPAEVFCLHSKDRVTRSSALTDMEARNPASEWSQKNPSIFSTVVQPLQLNTSFWNCIFLLQQKSFYNVERTLFLFPPPIAAMDRLNPAKHNYPKKRLTNHGPFSGSVTWDCRVWATEQQHWAIRAPNEMIQDWNRANAYSSAKSELRHLFKLGLSC